MDRRVTIAAAAVMLAGCGAMAWRFGFTPLLPALCFLVAVAVPLTVTDIRQQRLPDRLTLPAYPAALALLGIAAIFIPNEHARFPHALIGLAVAAAFYLVLAVIYPAGIGFGDVKLSGVLGLYLGWFGARVFLAGLLGGFVLAAVFGVALIAAGRATRKTQVPFGPFMLAAAVTAILVLGV
jgi:leader peptidase (prepilin peptidase) / N-methyltransferase